MAHRERRDEHDYRFGWWIIYATIAWLLRFVASHSFNRFVAYRIGLGTVLIGALSMGYLAA
ncbi:hypothetical protein GCM10027020_33030 [Nocardioides salsibiostraticola]